MSKERDPQTYSMVQGSTQLTTACKYVYWVLWGAIEGATRGEVARGCTAQGWTEDKKETWSKTVSLLSKMGLVERTNKRHCPVANKEDQVWEVTNRGVPLVPKINKPSAKSFRRGVEQFEVLLLHHQSKGDGLVTDDLQKLFHWVSDKAPKPVK